MQYGVAVRNARADVVEATWGASPRLQFWTGSKPVDCAAAATGTMLVDQVLPADPMSNASAGSKVKQGVWSGVGVAAGTAGYYRIMDNANTVCHEQGTVTATGGGGDMILDNVVIAVSQVVTVVTYQRNEGNA